MNYAFMKLILLLFLSFPILSKAQFYNECKPSSGNDTVLLDNGFQKYMVDSFYDNTLIRKRVYEDWGMSAEIYYDKEGRISESISVYKNGFKQWVDYWDYNTGHKIEAGWYENGQMRYYSELPEDSFDAVYQSYYEEGKLAEEGYYRKEKIQWVKSYTDTSFVLRDDTAYEWSRDTKVGTWRYYYKNGTDSASGNYAYLIYQFDSVIPYSPGDLVIAILTTTFSEIKTGTWNYFSADGKLIRREEWDKGNLLKRETF
jgi:antitoxin component YwqK of YwqJK toxin-antitoxin module